MLHIITVYELSKNLTWCVCSTMSIEGSTNLKAVPYWEREFRGYD